MKTSPYEIKIIQKQAKYHSDPTIIFNHLCRHKPSTLLLETAEINKKKDLESIMIIDSALRISSEKKNVVTLTAFSQNGEKILENFKNNVFKEIKILETGKNIQMIFSNIDENLDEDKKIFTMSVFDAFRLIIKMFKNTQKKQKAIFFGGLFSYDLITYFESVPDIKTTQKCPNFCFYLAETLLILDHQTKKCVIQSSIFTQDINEKNRIEKRTQEIQKKLEKKIG
jgi:anthranilate synthase component 1